MTPRQEADAAVQQFAALVAQSGQETTGIPRPATVESSETSLDPSPFNIELDPTTTAQAFPGNGSGVTGLTGACCVHGACSRINAAACATAGGTYLGDGTACPPSPAITLSCDSISASKSKCGFAAFDGSGAYYLTQTNTTSASASYDASAGCPPAISTSSWSSTRVDTYDPSSCTQSCTSCSGSGSFNVHFYTIVGGHCVLNTDSGSLSSGGCGGGFCTAFPFQIGYGTISGCDVTGSSRVEAQGCRACDGSSVVDSATSETITYACDPSGIDFFHGTVNLALSDEYTTADLISNTEAALPSYPGTFAGSCSASRDLTTDERTYTISRFKPKFTIPMALDDDLVICYNEHFVPDDGGDPVDTPQTVTIPGGDTEVEGDEVMEPGTDGEITITDITTCCAG